MSFTSQMVFPDNADPANSIAYDTISTNGLSTLRAVAGRDLDKPLECRISHEVSKDKSRQSSVILFDQVEEDTSGEFPVLGNLRVMLKIQFDRSVITEANVLDRIQHIANFISADANITKMLNREH